MFFEPSSNEGQSLCSLPPLHFLLCFPRKDGDPNISEITRKKIYNYYLLNAEETGDEHYKLLLTRSDKETLISILEGNEEPDQVSMRINDNYQFFFEKLRQGDIEPTTLYKGISKLVVVDIALEQQDNPQLIFESLNSTGMDLSQADLIRNYVLMGLDNREQINLYETYWYRMEQSFGHSQNVALFNRFMRDYLTIKSGTGEIPNMNKVYATFKVYHQSRSHISIREIVQDIYRYSKYFTRMALLQEKDDDIRRVLININNLEVFVAYPFLLEVYDDFENNHLSREDFIIVLKLIESFVFRRLICGIPTHGLNKVFMNLAKRIKGIDKDHYVESVQAAFLLLDKGARFPRDEEFRAAFEVKDVYNFHSRHYLVRKLENYGRKERVDIDEYTIEHVMPQNKQLSIEWQQELGSDWKEVQERFLHTIGNLTLTGYNSELSDRPFAEKRSIKGGFAHSPIQLNESLAEQDHWNAGQIEKRAQTLSNLAVKVWPIPNLSAEQLGMYGKRAQKGPLEEVIGPFDHPLAGFIPADYKITQISEKKFHYYRRIDGQWVQYGNGKVPWYAISWNTVGRWLRDFDKKDIKPLGVGGEIHPSYAKATNDDVRNQYGELEDTNSKNGYTLDNYPYLQGSILDLFEQLRKRILNLDLSVREEYKKLYIAYKTDTNFVDIVPQAKQLRLSLNMKFSEIDDPRGLCRDITDLGRWGNGDVEVGISSTNQLDDVMDLIRQAFERHWEEVYA